MSIRNRKWPIEWHRCQCLWMILNVTSAVSNFSDPIRLQYVYTWIRRHMWLVIQMSFRKLRTSWGHSSHLHSKLVISRKRCQMESLSQHTINRKWYMAYQIAAIRMTLSDLQGQSPILQALPNVIFREQCSTTSWWDFNWRSASRAVPLR